MTDDELAARLAVRVMRWHYCHGYYCEDMDGKYPIMLADDWSPATRWDHAGMLVSWMVAKGWDIDIGRSEDYSINWEVSLENRRKHILRQAPTAPRAISLAAAAESGSDEMKVEMSPKGLLELIRAGVQNGNYAAVISLIDESLEQLADAEFTKKNTDADAAGEKG